MKHTFTLLTALLFAPLAGLHAAEFHVATTGNDSNPGTASAPLRTIQHAAGLAQPGDVITVHEGVYRERINPPRGGASDAKRIVYQAAPGEKVIITGSDPVKGWKKVGGDTWKVTIPNSYFGKFNPYAEQVHGDWFNGHGRVHRRGNVYLNGEWLAEAPNADTVMKPACAKPMWFSKVDGLVDDAPLYLVNIVSFKTDTGTSVAATKTAARNGTQDAPSTEGGQCVGFITQGCWLRYDNVDFGTGSERVEFRAATAPGTGGVIELRDGHFDGELLGTCDVGVTGDWQKWQSFTAKIKKTTGVKNLYLVIKSHAAVKKNEAMPNTANTVIFAQFPGINPNEADVEICVRPTVFTPEKTNMDYITVRGFKLRNAATNWAAPTTGQHGLVTAYWCKGWIIENNEISYSRCSGIALGKYSDQWDGKRGTTEGYYLTIDDALKKGGWTKEKIGGHIVRNNYIHHCGQTGIVGSLGCAFSRIEGNEIHDCNMQGIWGGAEMGGIKFHGAIDTEISRNHIYRTDRGIWLDWMAQGARVTRNLLHDNGPREDLYMEVNHGPFVVDNNIFLSPIALLDVSQGGAYTHNLIAGIIISCPEPGRKTPWHPAHSTKVAGLVNIKGGDNRFYNNLLTSAASLSVYDGRPFPLHTGGNVPCAGVKLVDATLHLTLEFKDKTSLVTTELLGKAKIADLPYENPDGTPLKIDTDYFAKPRNPANPTPGPFENPGTGPLILKVW